MNKKLRNIVIALWALLLLDLFFRFVNIDNPVYQLLSGNSILRIVIDISSSLLFIYLLVYLFNERNPSTPLNLKLILLNLKLSKVIVSFFAALIAAILLFALSIFIISVTASGYVPDYFLYFDLVFILLTMFGFLFSPFYLWRRGKRSEAIGIGIFLVLIMVCLMLIFH